MSALISPRDIPVIKNSESTFFDSGELFPIIEIDLNEGTKLERLVLLYEYRLILPQSHELLLRLEQAVSDYVKLTKDHSCIFPVVLSDDRTVHFVDSEFLEWLKQQHTKDESDLIKYIQRNLHISPSIAQSEIERASLLLSKLRRRYFSSNISSNSLNTSRAHELTHYISYSIKREGELKKLSTLLNKIWQTIESSPGLEDNDVLSETIIAIEKNYMYIKTLEEVIATIYEIFGSTTINPGSKHVAGVFEYLLVNVLVRYSVDESKGNCFNLESIFKAYLTQSDIQEESLYVFAALIILARGELLNNQSAHRFLLERYIAEDRISIDKIFNDLEEYLNNPEAFWQGFDVLELLRRLDAQSAEMQSIVLKQALSLQESDAIKQKLAA